MPPWEKYQNQPPSAPGSLKSLRGPEVEAELEAAAKKSSSPDKAIGAGLINALLGAAGQVGDVQGLIDLGLDKLGMPPRQGKVSGGRFAGAPTSGDFKRVLEEKVGPVYKPQPGLETGLAKGAELLPNIMFGPGGVLRRGIENVAMPYIGGEAGRKLAEGTGYEAAGEIAGELVGGMSVPSVERALRPPPVTPSRQRLIDTLNQEGIGEHLTAGQRTGNRKLQNFETELGGEAYAARKAEQADAATRAAMTRIGGNETRATTDVVHGHVQRMGREFDRLEAASNVPLDQQLQNDLLDRITEYHGAGGIAPGPEQEMNLIANLAQQNNGVLSGEALQTIRARMGRVSRNAPPETRGVLRDMQEALDDAIERNISPQMRQDWQAVRRQYRNFIVLEDALTKAGSPDIAEGIIPPQALWGPQVAQNQRRFSTGQDDFSDLAHAGGGVLREPPQSGTAGRLAVRAIPAAVAGTVAGAGNMLAGGDLQLSGLAATGAALAAPSVAGRIGMTRPVQNWLAGQQPGALSEAARRQLLIQALTAPRLFAPQQE